MFLNDHFKKNFLYILESAPFRNARGFYFDFFMEAIHLGSASDDIPSSPIMYTREDNSFCITGASQFHNELNSLSFPKNQLQTDIINTNTISLTPSFVVLQEYNTPSESSLYNFSQVEPCHIPLKKRLKQGPVTFKPFESFRSLEETVRELNCYFQTECKAKHNDSCQGNILPTEPQCSDINVE